MRYFSSFHINQFTWFQHRIRDLWSFSQFLVINLLNMIYFIVATRSFKSFFWKKNTVFDKHIHERSTHVFDCMPINWFIFQSTFWCMHTPKFSSSQSQQNNHITIKVILKKRHFKYKTNNYIAVSMWGNRKAHFQCNTARGEF